MTTIWAALALFVLTQQPAAPAPTPTTGTASIAGVVVTDDAQPVPVRRAIVTISGVGLVPSRSTVTDDSGAFSIERLPAGRFAVSASRASFVTSQYGAKRPGKPGTPVVVGPGQRVAGLTVKLWRGAVIAGVVRTEDGRPAEGLPVRVFAARQSQEPSILTLDNNGARTNDAGEFRIFGLPPGAYLVAVTPPLLRGMSPTAVTEAEMDAALAALRTGRAATTPRSAPSTSPAQQPFAYAPIYFPATANMSQATPITLAPGQVVDNIDLQLQRVATASVGGVVIDGDGRGVSGATVMLTQTAPPGYTLDAPMQTTALTIPDGGFRIPAVTPGDYVVSVRANAAGPTADGRPGPARWAEATLSMTGADVAGMTLTVSATPAMSGRVAFDASTIKPPADLTKWRVSLVTPGTLNRRASAASTGYAAPAPMALNADGSFAISGVPPGAYVFQMTGPSIDSTSWWLRSMKLTASTVDRDLLDGLIEVRPGGAAMDVTLSMSDRHTELSGTLQTPTGQPAADVFVIAFSTDRTLWGAGARRVRAVRPGADGRYSMPDLPPGDYWLGVVTDVDPEDWQRPALLEQMLPTSIKVSIGEGEKKVQNLQLGIVGIALTYAVFPAN